MTTVHYYVLLLPVTSRKSSIYIEKAFFGLARSLRCMTFEKASVALLASKVNINALQGVHVHIREHLFSFPKNWPNCMVDV